MKPTIVLVGRPNVGKSTLFNRLTRSRDALVADIPGLTRDRHYGHGKIGDIPYLIVDTGGFEPVEGEGIVYEMARQTIQAIDEADAILFLVDGRLGLTAQDKVISNYLRKKDKPIYVIVNKAEGRDRTIIASEFFELGLDHPCVISATHGDGVKSLINEVLEQFSKEEKEEEQNKHPYFAVIGRPNVGKSTLVNAILGEERVIVFDEAGTTRDSIYIDFERDNQSYTIIDTAGVRRKSKVNEVIEKFSVIKTIQAIETANVVLLVLDASQDISDQDATIASLALESGRALVIVINKWDNIDHERKILIKKDVERKLHFLDFADVHYVSALKGTHLTHLFKSVLLAYQSAMTKLSTPRLTRVLSSAIERQAPSQVGLIRPKLRFAHQGGMNPPIVVIHGNALNKIPESYTRYLEKTFRKAFKLQGTPLRIKYQSNENPYHDRSKQVKNKPLRREALSNRIAKRANQKRVNSVMRQKSIKKK